MSSLPNGAQVVYYINYQNFENLIILIVDECFILFYYVTFDFASLYTLCVIGGLKLMCVADSIKFQVRKFTAV